MSQRVRILITGAATGEEGILREVDKINELQEAYEKRSKQILQRSNELQMYLGYGIITVSTANSVIYTMSAIQRMREGKGSIEDIISVGLNILIIVNRVDQLMKMTQNLQMASAALSFATRMRGITGRPSRFARFRR